MAKTNLQSYELDVDTALENVGGNRFQLILIAATRAREIQNKRLIAQKADPKVKHGMRICTEALNDVVEGKVGREYLNRIHAIK